MIAWPSAAELEAWLAVACFALAGWGAEMNPLEMEIREWPWYIDPMLLAAVLIIAAGIWWVWSGRAPH